MRCPTCGFENLLGSDICDNCGSDLAGRDVPEQAVSFRGQLLGEHLDDLGIVPAEIVDADADIDVAIQRMHDKGIDCVLVVDDGRFVGIFTDRDAVLKVAGTKLPDRTIRALMTRDPVVLRHDETIAVAINKMAVGGFRHIPIVEDGRPTGVVSARDVFRHLAQSLG
ncbi:MAG TPA: CBS domain-containing protein [Candidatus Limnocylindrales bacterium]|jgi:signal-transduction protein with cAMP-binding, CBS, and nucleotidyltransferase domain